MPRIIFVLILLFFVGTAWTEESEEPVNYCHDQSVDSEWDKMLAEAPKDPIVIKLYALRKGLCEMVDGGQVALAQAIEIWELERVQSVIRRFKEQNEKKKELSL